MKKYIIPTTYRGQQIYNMVCAKSDKHASVLLNTNVYFIRKYARKSDDTEYFNGIMSYFDSGLLWKKEKKFINKKMQNVEIKELIDKHVDYTHGNINKYKPMKTETPTKKKGRRPSDDPKQQVNIYIPKSRIDLLNYEKVVAIATEAVEFEYQRVKP